MWVHVFEGCVAAENQVTEVHSAVDFSRLGLPCCIFTAEAGLKDGAQKWSQNVSYPTEGLWIPGACNAAGCTDLTQFSNSSAWSTEEFLPTSLVREASNFHRLKTSLLNHWLKKKHKCSPKGNSRFCSVKCRTMIHLRKCVSFVTAPCI